MDNLSIDIAGVESAAQKATAASNKFSELITKLEGIRNALESSCWSGELRNQCDDMINIIISYTNDVYNIQAGLPGALSTAATDAADFAASSAMVSVANSW